MLAKASPNRQRGNRILSNVTKHPPTPLIRWAETPPGVRARWANPLAPGRLAIGMVLALVGINVVSRACSGLHVGFDLVANVSYFLAVPMLGISVVAACTRRWLAAAAALVGAFVAATPLLSPAARRAANPAPEATASVLHCNIRGSSAAWDALRGIMAARKPDMVSVVEVSDGVIERILADERLLQEYPHRVLPRPGLEWTQVVLSRHPMKPLPSPEIKPGTRMQSLFSSHRSNIVSLPIGDVIFSTEHVPSPRNSASWTMGNDQIVALGHLVRDHYSAYELPVLVTGDFNSSPSGYRDGLMRRATGLRPDPESFFPPGTWPSVLPAFLRLPLDRAWASEELAFAPPVVLGDVGSDHRPIYFRFAVLPKPAPPGD